MDTDKTAASNSSLKIPKSRSGRRPLSVTTLLRKDREGTLSKRHIKHNLDDARDKTLDTIEEQSKSAGKYGKNGAGFDLQGKTTVQGLPIAIENRVGSVREGKNEDGSKWRTKFRSPYGYIEGTKGADGEEIDAYVGPDRGSAKAFVVHQKKQNGKHDEDTVMLGYKNSQEARADILRHYDDKKQVGAVSPISIEELKAKLDKADGKGIKKIATSIEDRWKRLRARRSPDPEEKLLKSAFMDESNPYLRKMLIGSALGAAGGLGHEAMFPTARVPVTLHAQALDNTSPDIISVGGKRLSADDMNGRESAVRRVSRSAKKGKVINVGGLQSNERIVATGRNYLIEVPRPERDARDRVAPLVQHIDRREGTPKELLDRLREEASQFKEASGLGSEQANLDYRDGDRPDMTGLPAMLQRRKGEGPTREMQDPYPNPKVENRQEIQETKLMESPSPSEGFLDTGKVAELGHDRALGDQRKSWEGPTRDEVGASASDHHRLQTATGAESVRLSDISPEAKVAHLEASIRRGLLDELTKIGQANGVMPWSGNYSDFASSQLIDDLVKEALFRELAGGLQRGLVGGMSPQGVPMKGLLSGFKGVGQRLEQTGTQMMTSPAQRIQAAGAGAAEAKDLASQATRFGVRAPGVAKQIGGEAVQTAGKHVAHSSPLQLAVNPVGTVVGGGIEGATRGAGRALVKSTGLAGEAGGGGVRAGLGRAMQQHAAHAGLAGEIGMMGAAGGLVHLPLSGAGMVGGHLAGQSPMLAAGLHSLGPMGGHIGADLLGTMAHKATKTLPGAVRATGRLMQAEA